MIKKGLRYKTFLILGIVFIIALFLRTWNLKNYPVGFHIDEAVLGYNAYSFIKTGTDESGERFPLYLDTFGDQNPIGYHVLTIIPVFIFGLSEFATRFPAAIFGALSIFSIYFLCLMLFKDKSIALLSSLLFAISPWSINLSRGSSEASTAIFFVVLGFAFVVKSIKNKKSISLVFAFALFLCSFLIYPAPRVFVPLLCVFLLMYFIFDFVKKRKYALRYITFLGFIFISVGTLIFIVSGGTNRFKQTSIFNFPEVKLVLEEQLREDGTLNINAFTARIFHNKLLNFFLAFSENYFEYFSGKFLFIRGGLPMLTVIPNMGLVYLAELPFIIYAIYRIIVRKDKFGGIIIAWLILAPIVAALTIDDSPNVRRSILMVPAIEILAAVGIISFLDSRIIRYKKLASLTVTLILILNFSYFLHQYFIHGYIHRPWYRNNGFSKMMAEVGKRYDASDKIIITKTGGGYPLVLFYSKYDPTEYIKEGSPKDPDYKGFGKYIFVPQECPSIQSGVKVSVTDNIVFVDRGNCQINKGLLERVDIPREDGSLGFRVYYKKGK